MRFFSTSSSIAALFVISFLQSPAAKEYDSLTISDDLQLKYRAGIGVEYWYFPQDPIWPGQLDKFGLFNAGADVNLNVSENMDFRVNPWFNGFFEESDTRFFYIDNIYAAYSAEQYQVRAGYQIFSWNAVSGPGPADFLNQRYLAADPLNPRKEGEPAIFGKYSFDSEALYQLEAYLLPYFTPASYPSGRSRYFLLADTNLRTNFTLNPDEDLFRYQSSNKRFHPQGAVRFTAAIAGNTDAAAFYFNGYDRIPGLVNSTGIAEMTHEYRLIHRAGLTSKTRLGSFRLNAEAVVTSYQKEIGMRSRRFNETNRYLYVLKVPVYLEFALGGEYSISENLSVILEINGDTDSERDPDTLDQFKLFRNDVFLGFKYGGSESARAFEGGLFIDYKLYDLVWRVEYIEKLFPHLTLRCRYDDVFVNDQVKVWTSHINSLRHTRRLSAEAMVHF